MKRDSNKKARLGIVAGGILMALALPLSAGAHGEDKPGPHGGEIRMPGAFHTEVKQESGAFQVFLLDVQFLNPTTQNSSVEAKIRSGKKEAPLSCVANGEYFRCALPKGETLKKGELVIKANRAGAPGNDAVYKLPLRVKGGGESTSHSGH